MTPGDTPRGRGKNIARRIRRSELHLAMFLVSENGRVVPGREEWV